MGDPARPAGDHAGGATWLTALLAFAGALAAAVRLFFRPDEQASAHSGKGARYITLRDDARRFGNIDTGSELSLDALTDRAHAGFITMTWSYKPGARPMVVMAQAAPLMSQHSVCEKCGCSYASIGAAFFCPAANAPKRCAGWNAHP